MGSTFPSTLRPTTLEEPAQSVLTWRSWPLVDHSRWSWTVVAGILALGAAASYVSGSWPLALLAMAAIVITSWQFFVPVWYEISPLGLRRSVFGKSRLLPWHAVRSYWLRPTGVVLYRRPNPAPIELLRSVFMPYPPDVDDAIVVLRTHLSHATESPASVGVNS